MRITLTFQSSPKVLHNIILAIYNSTHINIPSFHSCENFMNEKFDVKYISPASFISSWGRIQPAEKYRMRQGL